MKKLLLLLSITFGCQVLQAQNVGINTSGAAPATSAMLDIVASDRGLLIPRVTLSGTGDATTITGTEPNGLLVYNTTAAGSGATAVSANTFYFWDLTATKWVALGGNGGKEWNTLGNSGTTAGTNFLGTTDDIDLQFKRFSILSGKLNDASQITSFGVNAGLLVTGADNSFFGHSAGKTVTTGVSNTGIGVNAAKLATSSYNTAVGTNSLQALSTGGSNTFMGVSSGYYYSTGSGNTGIGMYAVEGGNGTGTGSYNTAIGFAAGSGYTGAGTQNYLALTSGSYNSFLGYSSAANSGTLTNASAIGAYSRVDQSNSIILGSINGNNGATASANVGIGTTTPDASFMLDVKAIDGASGTGWTSTTTSGGIIGRTQTALNYQAGVFGWITGSADNTAGVVGSYSSTQYGALGHRISSTNIVGAFGTTSSAAGYGVYGENTNAAGTGVYGYGSTYGVYGYTPSVATSTYGVFGSWSSARYGYLGGRTSVGYYVGAYGTVNGATDFASLGWNTNTSGTGVVGGGNNVGSVFYQVGGSGGAFTGTQYGVYGYCTNTSGQRAGGLFDGASANAVLVSAYSAGGTSYKIWGTGTVSTIVDDLNGKKVTLHCPETPEIYFQDFGQGQLVNGTTHIDFDKIFAKNVLIDAAHPLRAFIQLEDNENCKGVVVKNKTKTGFDVVELDGGKSNTPFSWTITCNRADEYDANGNIVSRYQDVRFEPGPIIDKPQTAKMEVVKDIKDAKREVFNEEVEKKE